MIVPNYAQLPGETPQVSLGSAEKLWAALTMACNHIRRFQSVEDDEVRQASAELVFDAYDLAGVTLAFQVNKLLRAKESKRGARRGRRAEE